ncbi:NUDIX domain-containing protein [Curtobacterium sp. 9128]|uniref:NUDIX domain-containing protein n=1 Tax=Curtobacterium sp. 9128 TaxID=1793722 RepID=UPI0007D73039|nr:NUDIX domain-containing protein [Curtobacterium sp. 9128]SBN62574.1 NUDIX domain-containing protein [Curtobacterium sp. 9128]
MIRHEHFGVYGAWLQDGLLVTVEKSRGPYTGWIDLPGGAPEPGETEIQTLRRELDEECGVTLAGATGWESFEFHLDPASDGTPIDFVHRGRIALVRIDEPVREVVDVEDVARVVLASPHSAVPLTPAAQRAWAMLGRPVSGTVPA